MNTKKGWFTAIVGCMFSGKTDELIRRAERPTFAGYQVQVFKHRVDTRYDESAVASHSGARLEAVAVPTASEILGLVDPRTAVVAIDEVMFFGPNIVQVCETLAARGIRVIVAGLNLDFRGEPFGPMPELMARADEVVTLHAVCVVCGAPASRTQRLIDNQPADYSDAILMVGKQDFYEARCRQCHEVPRERRDKSEN